MKNDAFDRGTRACQYEGTHLPFEKGPRIPAMGIVSMEIRDPPSEPVPVPYAVWMRCNACGWEWQRFSWIPETVDPLITKQGH